MYGVYFLKWLLYGVYFEFFGVYVVKRHCVDRGVKFGVYLRQHVFDINETESCNENGVLFGRLLQQTQGLFNDFVHL